MIKYMIMDVDGSLTDGKIYIGPNGEVMKAFSTKDGYGIAHVLPEAGITPAIITGRESKIVEHRCKELGIEMVRQDREDKYVALLEMIDESEVKNCAYFGDDILDLSCMLPIKEAGGLIGCPADAVWEVKEASDYICKNKGGDGALREFAEWIIAHNGQN